MACDLSSARVLAANLNPSPTARHTCQTDGTWGSEACLLSYVPCIIQTNYELELCALRCKVQPIQQLSSLTLHYPVIVGAHHEPYHAAHSTSDDKPTVLDTNFLRVYTLWRLSVIIIIVADNGSGLELTP